MLLSLDAMTEERNRVSIQTQAELESALGDSLRALRLDRNIDQKTLAERAGISVLRTYGTGVPFRPIEHWPQIIKDSDDA